ncbi:hypothetical protein [uncultured Parvimonas sp.]|uniref:hypothetical protein n=1 Tax=uncultured Parvimonas sp. TaxID=747372 RepID=UPI0028D6D40D|nr:hypothetical protein [uncultured Parvimonas sp.]
MQDKKVFLYYFLAIGMVLFPILNLLSFVPMVILYKKSNLRMYILSAGMYSILSIVILGNFTALIPVIISFIFIKGMDKGVDGYKIMFGSAIAMAMLLVSDFMLLELNSNAYEAFLKTMAELLDNFKNYKEILRIGSVEAFVETMKTIYPAISFGISFVFCSLGYSFLSKKIYKLNRDSDDMIMIYSSKFPLFGICISLAIFFASIFGIEKYYKVFLITYNLMLMFIEIMIVQGFIKFNVFLKSKYSAILANSISIISIFFAIVYLGYFIYGIYSSIKRGMKWERK